MTGLNNEKKITITQAYKTSVRYNTKNIHEGHCLVIDPSSGGHSSLTAYAVLKGGTIIDEGEIPITAKLRTRDAYVGHRLQELGKAVRAKFSRKKFDLLAIELIYHEPSPNTVLKSFYNLVMSIGAIHATIEAKYRMVVPPWDWKKYAPEGYKKSDLGDVRLMAEALLRDAQELRHDKQDS